MGLLDINYLVVFIKTTDYYPTNTTALLPDFTGGLFEPVLGGHFEMGNRGHFAVGLGGQFAWFFQSTAEATEKLLNTLINGHRQVVTMQKDGNEQKLFIEANPQFKSVNVYDENLKKISIASVLGNKTSEPLQSNQKISIEQKVEQRKKNGLSL